MLELKHVSKDYLSGAAAVHALRSVDLAFREPEFVAVLGHSGCGKTTLLNIIGGLDRYSAGDLLINGRSTKQFSDADWDSYRNHSVGFVFQSYQLIPHQSVLANVELALTLSGVRPAERRRRAVEALEQVGLGDQLHKRPNQMSGGQMQRVAIARALVNDPDILLADEPTGALDSDTSVQIMEILRAISKSKLIIMVTHNPELAESYASRIIRLKDGQIVDDSRPFAAEDADTPAQTRVRRPSMRFRTALSLSFHNLLTKKARTLLTAFAGSIGIIGIALILSLSNGVQSYIDQVQKDTLASYPITIQAERVDVGGLMRSMMGVRAESEGRRHGRDAVYASTVLYDMMNAMLSAKTETNHLQPFMAWLEDENGEAAPHISSIQVSYDLDLNVYAEDARGHIAKTDVVDLMQQAMTATYGGDYSAYFANYGQMYSSMNVWQELLPGEEGEAVSPLLKEQYELLYGAWPENYDETVLVVSENNEISDVALYALGLKSSETLAEDMQALTAAEKLETTQESWSYEELCALRFRYIFPADQFQYDEASGTYLDLSREELGLRSLYRQGLELKITGIIRQREDVSSAMLTGTVCYTHALVEHVIAAAAERELVQRQLADPAHDVFNGLPFLEREDEGMSRERKAQAARDYIAAADEAQKAALYVKFASQPTDEALQEMLDEQLGETDADAVRARILEQFPEYAGMIAQMDDEMLTGYFSEMLGAELRQQYAAGLSEALENLSDAELAADFDLLLLEEEDLIWLYDNAMPPVFSDSSWKDNLRRLGFVDRSAPDTINIYASSFEDKDAIAAAIEHYNESAAEDDQISYTDIVALLMSSITTIIRAISYVLIAFVAVSLVVSSIMIGIITYISVLERTREIGILRAIGASKRDVSRVFNAETVIIGFSAGLIGVGATLLLTIPTNLVVHELTGIEALSAALPPLGGAVLVLISMFLTYIAGLIPAGVAARKDPVEALRSE